MVKSQNILLRIEVNRMEEAMRTSHSSIGKVVGGGGGMESEKSTAAEVQLTSSGDALAVQISKDKQAEKRYYVYGCHLCSC